MEYILEAVESKDSTFEQRDKALKAVIDLYLHLCGCESEDEFHRYTNRLMEVLLNETSRRATTNEPSRVANAEIGDALMSCIVHGSDALMSLLIDDETAMPFVFHCILSADDEEHKVFSFLLGFLVEFASASDRVTLIIRYFSRLRKAMFSILQRGTNFRGGEFRKLFETEEMIGVVCTLPSFCVWLSQGFNQPGIPSIIVVALETSLESPRTLEMLLGYGLLKISHYFSRLPINRASAHTANVFSAVLALHPEWEQMFRRWTSEGVAGNPTAILGRSIAPRPQSVGILYIFNEEDDDI